MRNLEREIGNVCRKVARKVVNNQSGKDKKQLAKSRDHRRDRCRICWAPEIPRPAGRKKNEIGAAVGLGLDRSRRPDPHHGSHPDGRQGQAHHHRQTRRRDAGIRAGRHELHPLAGASFGLPRDFYRNLDVHVHIPEGAIPKDGPSAGITIATTICSALTRIPVRGDVAMTGEITLRGKVLPIGGLKEKLMAAHRHGIFEAIMPMDNEKDLPDIPEHIRNRR